MIGASDHREIGTKKYLVLFEKTSTGYSAYVPDLPGCIATADTLEETKRLIREGIE
jgi:predicted RNase H-like HicB family nuclease